MSLASEIRHTQEVVGFLIESLEGISYDVMNSLFDREIVVDETGFSDNSENEDQMDLLRYLDCSDSFNSIVKKLLM